MFPQGESFCTQTSYDTKTIEINQSLNQSINQSSQSTNQPTNQSINQTTDQHQPIK